MKTAVLTLQSKGQIMLPKEWREDMDTKIYQAVKEGNVIILQPVKMVSDKEVLKSAVKIMKKNSALLKSLADK